MKAGQILRWSGWCLGLGAALVVAGCGTPGAPLAPTLDLPDRVSDLAASRTGNVVSLSWTMPRKNTDRLLLKDDLAVRVCRTGSPSECDPALNLSPNLRSAPGASASWQETLPPALSSGAPRPLSYFLEIRNRHGRSVGLSNAAVVLAGSAPAPVTGLSAQVRKDGVMLRWSADGPGEVVRLQRRLLTPVSAAPRKSAKGPLASPSEPVEQRLLVDSVTPPGRALDKDIHFGEAYEYRAQRILRINREGQMLELPGELSPAVRVDAEDTFPPAVPAGLVAVATASSATSEPAIDLSWQPDIETDLAGYIVYRREGTGAWERISPAQPTAAPAFHDSHVQPGYTYRYAVSAVDQRGSESARSPEAEESVPSF